ncbi:MAG: hypothetical protein JOZ48_18335 [Acidobacteriaceae bacterium]|nr:hypothetical protein [Acidobacteriaceae bacterium]
MTHAHPSRYLADVSSTRPMPITDLRVTGEDGRRVKLTVAPWTGSGGNDQRSLYVMIKADGRRPLAFFIDEDDIALGTDETLFWLVAWLTHARVFCPSCEDEQELPRPL